AQAATAKTDVRTAAQNYAAGHQEEAEEEEAQETPQPAGAKHRRLTLGGTFAGAAAPAASAPMGEGEADGDVSTLGRLQTSAANAQKLGRKLGAPLSNNIVAWKGRATSMKELSEGMGKLVRSCSRDGGTNELMGKETLDHIKSKIEAEGMTHKASAIMAGGPLRKEPLRTWWPMSVAAPGWSTHCKDEVPLLLAERDFTELITSIALDKDTLNKIRRDVEEGAEMVMEKAKGAGIMEPRRG
ncbi:unnamed protein product, partial [Prorocentrum cordatum]